MNLKKEKRYYSISTASLKTGVSRSTIYRMIKTGKIKADFMERTKLSNVKPGEDYFVKSKISKKELINE